LRLIAARGRLRRAEFAAEAALVHFSKPRIPLVSTVGGPDVEADPASPEYWVARLQQPVQLAQGLATIHQQGHEVFLEAGPRPILVALGRQRLAGGTQLWLPSLAPPLSDWRQLATTLGHLYVKGVGVDWRGFDRDYHRRKVALPIYPFQRQRYWLASGSAEQPPPGA
jgi:myxalamid-type polyketide synthase MxaE and MxaD